MKETDIIDPVRIGKFSLGYFRWSVTAHIFQPKRFWKYCTKQVYEWKRGLSLQFISLTGIYTLLMFISIRTASRSLHQAVHKCLFGSDFHLHRQKQFKSRRPNRDTF